MGKLLRVWNRHNMRAAHVHLIIKAAGFRTLTTQLYPAGDKWANTDVVFGPKKSLVIVRRPPKCIHPACPSLTTT